MTEVSRPLTSSSPQENPLTHGAGAQQYAQNPDANSDLLAHMERLAGDEAAVAQSPAEVSTEQVLLADTTNRGDEANAQTPEHPWPDPEVTSPRHTAEKNKIIRFIPDSDELSPPKKKLTAMVVEDGGTALTGAGLPDPRRSGGVQLAKKRETAPPEPRFPWEVAGAPELAKNQFRKSFENFQAEQLHEPLPTDPIRIPGGIQEGSVEWTVLATAGFSGEDIVAGTFTRGDLMRPDVGFFFVNRLGGGEKALIHATIPDPRKPGEEIDFSKRSLLTREELEIAYSYQQAQGYGLKGNDARQVQADALLFLESAFTEPPFKGEKDFNKFCLPGADSDTWVVGSEADHQMVGELFQRRTGWFPDRDPADALAHVKMDGEIVDIVLQGQAPTRQIIGNDSLRLGMSTVYGREAYPMETISSRNTKLTGQVSPFLESGFVFTNGPDVFMDVGRGQMRRFNMVNIHLINAHPDFPGFSEMGQADWDQGYMSTAEYVDKFYPDKPIAKKMIWTEDLSRFDNARREKIIAQAQERLIAYAKQHQDEVITPIDSSW